MWRNYLTTAYRNLIKQRFYSIINILGLSIGLAGCLMISLFVVDETGFDQFHQDADRIHRMRVDLKLGESVFDGAIMPAPFAPTVAENYPEVEVAARFRAQGSRMVRAQEAQDASNINEDLVVFADKEVFDIFTFAMIAGDPQGLSEPNTVAISRTCAERHFGSSQAVDKVLLINNENPYQVVAVFEDLPHNSHFHFDLLLSMEGLDESKQPMWVSHNFVTYLKLREGASVEALNAKFPDLIASNVGPQIQQFLGTSMEELAASGDRIVYFTQPLLDIHLAPNVLGDLEPGGDIAYVYIFSAVALFLLLIACINFMNLSTARSSNRAKEVGVRKALGSLRIQLTNQFLIESLLVTAIAMILAIGIAYVALPYFNNLSGKDLALPWRSAWFAPVILSTFLVVGLAAGFYPAMFLSGFKPVEVLKGKLALGSKSGNLRSALVVFQFATSIVLIVSTIVVYQQLGYVQNRNLGYEKDQILIFDDTYYLGEKGQAFKNSLLQFPEVKMASYSSFLPVSGSNRNNSAYWPTGNKTQEFNVILQNWTVDEDYLQTLEMKVLEGRSFDNSFGQDSLSVILNETAVRQFGLGPDPLGKKISGYTGAMDTENPEDAVTDFTVIGVVQDFHFESLKDQIAPLGLFMGNSQGSLITKLEASEVKGVLSRAEEIWKSMAPGYPFSYSFMDERFADMYENESRVGQIFGTFAGLAVLIACLGLFALATFMAEQKTKEIGVRKVLGATNQQILMLLSKDFIKLVLIGIIFAVPIAWYFMDQWLQNYHYQVGMNIWSFTLAGLLAIAIAFLTVSSQSWRASRMDPARSLRDE